MYFLDDSFCLFVPLWVMAYWLAGRRLRNLVLAGGAVGWLAYFSLKSLLGLSFVTLVIIYPTAHLVGRARARNDHRLAQWLSWAGICVLVIYTVGLRLTGYLPGLHLNVSLLLWIGYSYLLLKAIGVIRGVAIGVFPAPSPVLLFQYMLFLPTLTAGPLYRLDAFSDQYIAPKRLTAFDIQESARRIIIGLGKKVLIALPLSKALVVLHASTHTQPLAYPLTYLMLYFDFAGYSDIAVGLSRALGFQAPENFKHPFTATTMTQFWRNWHASLGDWLRENIFIPLGGMRAHGAKLYAIVAAPILFSGVWHEFGWRFVLWGLYHSAVLIVEQALKVKPLHARNSTRTARILRYCQIQGVAMFGMFAFIGHT